LRSRSELLFMLFLLTVILLAGRALGDPVCSCQQGSDAGSYCGYTQLTDTNGNGAKQDWLCDISCSRLIPGPGPVNWEYFVDRVEIYFTKSSDSGHGTYSYSGTSTLTFEECYYNLDGSLSCKSIWSPRSFFSSKSISFSSYYTGDQGPYDYGSATLDSGYYLFRLSSSRSSYRSHLEVYWGTASAWNSIYFWLTAVTYSLTVAARVEGQGIGNGFVGGFDVSGNLVSGKLTFSGGNISGTITGSGRPGTSYTESVPRAISLYPAKRVLSGRWTSGTGDFTTQDSYTGTYNVSYTWSFTEAVQYQVWLYACRGSACRQLYYLYSSGSGGSATISNIRLDGEKLRAVAQGWYIDVDPSGNYYRVYVGGSLQVSMISNTPVTLYFAYWDTPGGRVYNTTLTGTLSSDTQVMAVYASPTLSVVAEVANFTLSQGTTVSGILQVSGSPVSGILTFTGTSLRSSTLSTTAGSGSVYTETVPQSLVLMLTTDRVALVGSTLSPTTSAMFYSSSSYTGTFNVSISLLSYASGTVSLDACTQGGSCRNLYSGSVQSGRGPTVANVQLSGERLRLSVNLSSPSLITASVTLSNSSARTFRFAYWDTPSGKIYSTTVFGYLVSSLRLTAVYSLSGGINAALALLPGMDFLPHNTTHFIPLLPGIYTVETNATVILLDASATRIYSVKGMNATVKVLSAFGETAKVGTTRKSSRLPATTLPIVLIGNQTFYLFSITAPETPNSTIYLKVNSSTYIYRVVVPRIEVTEIDYSWDAVRIHFNAYPSWENYNITALLDGRELSSATASSGVLEVRYEELQGVTTPRIIELAPSWGGRLKIPGERLKLLLLPVAVELRFHSGSSGLVLTASEPWVLGVNATLRQALIAVNETPNMGDLCIRLMNASKQAVWQVCVPYPYVAEVPYFDTSGHFLEVIYVPAPTKRVIVFPWRERL